MTRAASVLCVILLASCLLSATAGEIVRFKNGHQMVVRKSEVNGDTILLTLEDGSVLGFPKELVTIEGSARAQRYVPVGTPNRVHRGPTAAQLKARADGTGNMLPDQVISASELDGRSVMMGYSRPGAGRISADALGGKKAGQKAGGTFQQARARQQGEQGASRKKAGGVDAEAIPAPEIPKIRPVFADDKQRAAADK